MNEHCHNDFHLAIKIWGLSVEDHGPLAIGQLVRRFRSSPYSETRKAKLEQRRLRREQRRNKEPKPKKEKHPESSYSLLCRKAMKRCRKARATRESVVSLISELTTLLQSWPDEVVNVLLAYDAD